jgi:hypothetical protein
MDPKTKRPPVEDTTAYTVRLDAGAIYIIRAVRRKQRTELFI